MGYYINPPVRLGKAGWLIEHEKATLSTADKANICVVNNVFFDAAAYIYNDSERRDFTLPDDLRPKIWLVMDETRAKILSGFK